MKKKVSLVLATMGRVEELFTLFESLVAQTYKDFEVIVVDQNNDNRLESVIAKFSAQLDIQHVKHQPGLSKSRNFGLQRIQGSIVGFPDDDCYYRKDAVENIIKAFKGDKNVFAISTSIINSLTNEEQYKTRDKDNLVLNDVIGGVCSISMFFKKEVFELVGGFDEQMGLGAGTKYSSAEDYEFFCRVVHKGLKTVYCNEVKVYHPFPIENMKNREQLSRRLNTAGSSLSLIHKRYFSLGKRLKTIGRYTLGYIGNTLLGKKKSAFLHKHRLKGYLRG